MKWFKHDTTMHSDAKIKKLRLKYGMEGYGVYCLLLEYIARNIDRNNLTFELEEDAELVSHDTGIHVERIQEMMTYMVNLRLFENDVGVVTCLKLSTRTDEYTQKLLRNLEDVPTLSRHCPDKVPPNRIEEKRTEQTRGEEKRTEEPSLPAVTLPAVDGYQATDGFVPFPETLNVEAWKEFIDHRIALKVKPKIYTSMGAKKTMNLLAKYTFAEQGETVDASIINSWKGLFPEKTQGKSNEKFQRTQKLSAVERVRQATGFDMDSIG